MFITVYKKVSNSPCIAFAVAYICIAYMLENLAKLTNNQHVLQYFERSAKLIQ